MMLLLKKHARLLKENARLREENVQYRESEKLRKERTEQLEEQVHILKTSAGKLEGKERADFEKGISRYIRYIDKCIALLNK